MGYILAVLVIIGFFWAIFALDPRIRKKKLSPEFKRYVDAQSKRVAKFLDNNKE